MKNAPDDKGNVSCTSDAWKQMLKKFQPTRSNEIEFQFIINSASNVSRIQISNAWTLNLQELASASAIKQFSILNENILIDKSWIQFQVVAA
jgi:hypothetical protein